MKANEKAILANATGAPDDERDADRGLGGGGAVVALTLPFPPSANTYWKPARGRGLVPSDEAMVYKRAVARLAARQSPLIGPVRVVVELHRPRKAGDLDNGLKVLFDALNGIAWLDDSQVVQIVAERFDGVLEPSAWIRAEGERFATPAEAKAHADAKREAAKKRKKTLRLNRAAKRAAAFRATPAYRGAR